MDYLARFEKLRALVLKFHPTLTESYFVSSFISGLDNALRPIVKMMCPVKVEQAVERARLHETTLEAISRKHRWQLNGYAKSNQQIEGIPKTTEALRFRLVVTRCEKRSEMEQAIQDDKGGKVATRVIIEAPTEEKSVEMNLASITMKFEGQLINHDEVAWEQNIDSLVMLANSQAKDKVNQDPDPAERARVSLDHTGQVGTYFFSISKIDDECQRLMKKLIGTA